MAKQKEMSREAIRGFELWFEGSPGVPNPTDLNTREKYDFAMWFCETHGRRYFWEMQRFRKRSGNYPQTQYDYWKEKYPVPEGGVKVTKLENYDRDWAKELYCKWFSKYPHVENPTDIDLDEKAAFLREIGWKAAVTMQKARKENTKPNGYPNPWTMPDFWKEDSRAAAAN